jgi:hypothetical protein
MIQTYKYAADKMHSYLVLNVAVRIMTTELVISSCPKRFYGRLFSGDILI